MAADSNMGFRQEAILASALNRHSISFQSGAVNSTSGMFPMGNSFGVTSHLGVSRASNSSSVINNNPGMINQGGNSFGVSSPSGISRASNSSSVINNSPEIINHGGNSFGVSSPSGISRASNSSGIINNNLGMINLGGNSSGDLLIDSVPGLKHELELAVEWSIEEQSKLEEGLVTYADEISIMRYIKVAATLPEKTVRDVALRCRWMTKKENGKRRKPEEHYMGKKMKDRKEKLVESSSKSNVATSTSPNMNAYPLMVQHVDSNDRLTCEELSSTTRHLLCENAQILSQITANLATLKVQDNIDLFCHTRNNITAVLNNMRYMSGVMSRMTELPVTINEELMNSILPNPAQAMMFGSPSSIYMKPEPRC